MEIYTYMLCVCAIFSIEHHPENLDSEQVSRFTLNYTLKYVAAHICYLR